MALEQLVVVTEEPVVAIEELAVVIEAAPRNQLTTDARVPLWTAQHHEPRPLAR